MTNIMQDTKCEPNNLAASEEQKQSDPNSYAPYNTPMQELRNILSPMGVKATYNVTPIGHEFTQFKCCASFKINRTYIANTGFGRTNYEAKLSASTGLLNTLRAIFGNMYDSSANEAPKAYGNPVGVLQEMCGKRHWELPQYDVSTTGGLQHSLVFHTVCHVQNFKTEAAGPNKKTSKRKAAQAMLKILMEEEDYDEEEMTLYTEPTANGQCVDGYSGAYAYSHYSSGTQGVYYTQQ